MARVMVSMVGTGRCNAMAGKLVTWCRRKARLKGEPFRKAGGSGNVFCFSDFSGFFLFLNGFIMFCSWFF